MTTIIVGAACLTFGAGLGALALVGVLMALASPPFLHRERSAPK